MASQAKDLGNAAFAAGRYEEAIQHFTTGIELEPQNHVFYSNRSAALASLKKYYDALSDAEKCTTLKPDWARVRLSAPRIVTQQGWSRKGAALYGLGRYPDAAEAYKKGIAIEPGNAQMQSSLNECVQAQRLLWHYFHDVPESAKTTEVLFECFNRPDLLDFVLNNPKLIPYAMQPDFIQIVKEIAGNPQAFMRQGCFIRAF